MLIFAAVWLILLAMTTLINATASDRRGADLIPSLFVTVINTVLAVLILLSL